MPFALDIASRRLLVTVHVRGVVTPEDVTCGRKVLRTTDEASSRLDRSCDA